MEWAGENGLTILVPESRTRIGWKKSAPGFSSVDPVGDRSVPDHLFCLIHESPRDWGMGLPDKRKREPAFNANEFFEP